MKPHWTYLANGEYITQVGGRFGHWTDKLVFKTSTGRLIQGGGSGGNEKPFLPAGVEKPCIVAFEGGYGGHLHNIKAFYVDLAKVPICAQQAGYMTGM